MTLVLKATIFQELSLTVLFIPLLKIGIGVIPVFLLPLLKVHTRKQFFRYWEDFIQFSPNSLTAPGSRDSVNVQKSNECLGKVLRYMAGK